MNLLKKYIPGVLILGLLAAPAALSAAEGIALSIRFYDRRVYYAPAASGDPILVQITLANNSPDPYRFKLADDRAFSVDFEVKTLANRTAAPADILIRRRTQSRPVFFREVSVESGESFSFIEDIRDYVVLNESGAFVVRARMFPDLLSTAPGSGGSPPLESNRLSLSLRPPSLPGPDGIPLELDVETNAVLVRESLPPDEVVAYALTARQKSQWEKFFLYLDLEAMLRRDPRRQRQWLAESEEGRRRMLARYRTELESAVVDEDIATIPLEFTIERTGYTANEGTVTVLEKFRLRDIVERKRYTYDLRRRDNIWTIVGYTVQNLGTE
ncbi:MAG: hypothetical protein LBU28_05265 [Spirochaetaceae bacterium]|jgi:hypothetical protein|nr:hypothetical protein [Spirochaetaceae bacterium]